MDEALLLPQCVEESPAVGEATDGISSHNNDEARAVVVEGVIDQPSDDNDTSQISLALSEGELTDDVAGDDDDAGSMSFNLQTSGLAVQIKTKMAANMTVVELQSKLEFALLMLNQTEARLEAAHRRIGFLEAHLEAQAQQPIASES